MTVDQPRSESRVDVVGLLERGNQLSRLRKYDEALVAYEQILAFEPDHADVLNNYGATLGILRRDQDAIVSLSRALEIRPEFAEALNNRGTSFARLGMHGDALQNFDAALRILPNYVEALRNRGMVLYDLKRYGEAVAALDLALNSRANDQELLDYRGKALLRLDRREEALESIDRALAIAPKFFNALIDRGNVLLTLQRYEEAVASFERALEINPCSDEALNNCGYAFDKLTRYADALASYERAIAARPDYVEALYNRGVVMAKLGRFADALEDADEVQKIQPNFVKSHLHEGLTRLRIGDFSLGLRKYEWRWLDKMQGISRREFSQPLWVGKGKLSGRTILLHAEQGLGDSIQFARYVPLVAAQGATVLLEIPEVLAPLMKGLECVSRILIQGEPPPVTDFHCPLLSLPLAFGTTMETIPASVPYLSVDSGAAAKWRRKLASRGEKLVGICWRGSPDYEDDRERSIQFVDFAPLLSVPGIRFVSLQKELTEEERQVAATLPMVHPGADFKSTAEMIAALDLVISVDTVWAHWGGAIGRPLWVLLPYSPHWVWFTEREDSPWYPTARLFRQARPGASWESVIRNVKKELAKPPDTV